MTPTLMSAGLTNAKSHVALFAEQEQMLPGAERSTIASGRRAAIAAFERVGFPNERNEDWKFTSVAPILRTPMRLPGVDSAEAIDAFRANLFHTGPGVAISCINGNAPFVLRGSQPLPEGVVVGGLSEAVATYPELVEDHLASYVPADQPFAALNTAFWRHGVLIHVPAGVVVEEPILLGNLVASYNENGPYLWYRRVLVVLGRGARATVVEEFNGIPVGYMTNSVTEVIMAEEAHLDHYKVQQESPEALHVACLQAVLGRASNFATHYVGFGGRLVRNESRVVFNGANAQATVNGLYQASGNQHMDNVTMIDHAQPNCQSHELYKGVLDGQARGVFNGKIFVRLDAQKTDAKQTNKTLLLSEDASINTKPQLEILADDVKCTHGATVGQLDEQQLFYLCSRGIGKEQAQALLTFAFANDIISRVKVAGLRQRLEGVLLETSHLPRLAETEDE